MKLTPMVFIAAIPTSSKITGMIIIAQKNIRRLLTDIYLFVSRYIRSQAFFFIHFLLMYV